MAGVVCTNTKPSSTRRAPPGPFEAGGWSPLTRSESLQILPSIQAEPRALRLGIRHETTDRFARPVASNLHRLMLRPCTDVEVVAETEAAR